MLAEYSGFGLVAHINSRKAIRNVKIASQEEGSFSI